MTTKELLENIAKLDKFLVDNEAYGYNGIVKVGAINYNKRMVKLLTKENRKSYKEYSFYGLCANYDVQKGIITVSLESPDYRNNWDDIHQTEEFKPTKGTIREVINNLYTQVYDITQENLLDRLTRDEIDKTVLI